MSTSSDVAGSLNGFGEMKTFVCAAFLPFTTHKTHVNPALSDDVGEKITL